jgi:hypothetical protein
MPKVPPGRAPRIDLETQMVACRTFGHAWDEFYPIGMRRPSFGFRFSLRCVRCTAERHDLCDSAGNLLQREYRHPDGYSLADAPTRAEFRVELHRRRLADARRDRSSAG